MITPSTMSSTSFSAGPVGERKPELSTTQLVQLVSPDESVSVLGLKLSFGERTAFDGPASLGPALTEAEIGASCNRWKKLTPKTIVRLKT